MLSLYLGRKPEEDRLEPGSLFPSLEELAFRDAPDDDDDVDPRVAFQQMQAMFRTRQPSGGVTRRRAG